LAQAAETAGFKSVTVIDDDLGRSGSGSTQRPGFERLVAMVCLIDLCALAGALVARAGNFSAPALAATHCACRESAQVLAVLRRNDL
jgi:hypothetical protein